MRINTAKRLMLDGKPALGANAGLGAPLAAEALSLAGFDWVAVDNQHGSWDEESSLMAFRSILIGSAVPMARVRANDYSAIGKLLDNGALGIIVPMVNTVEDAQAAAYAMRYLPRGGRSLGPFAARFHGDDYVSWIDDEVFLAVQIETKQAVENAEAILSVSGVDGCWIGPADLARSLDADLNTTQGSKAHEDAMARVLAACHRTNKIPGIAAGDTAQRRLDQGFLFVTACGDRGLVADGAAEMLRNLRRPA